MTSSEFIDQMVGVPWVNRAQSLNECDCYGLIILYYRHVHGIELSEHEGYSDGSAEMGSGFFVELDKGQWKKSDCGDGVAFMAFITIDGERVPGHCGVIIGDYCLHAQGWEDAEGHHGQVQCTKINSLKRLYKNQMEFYKYVG